METTIDELLRISKECGASDLHVTVGIPPKMRINGKLTDFNMEPLSPSGVQALVTPMLNEHNKAKLDEMGEVDFAYAIGGLGRFRANVFRQRGSYAIVIRIVGTKIPKAQDLGLPESVIALTEKKHGLILVTGPTGSGKSTTLASLIDQINNNYNLHVITLEDPIEYLHSHKRSVVNQREIGLDTQSYAKALRSALREDPDVILVGEMRDLDTISIAITAAETGHLVFSTLHTTGAANTIDRVIDVFPPHQQQQIRVQLASVLEAVISQQLIPTIDNHGRVAAFEIMHVLPSIRNLIRESKTHQIDSMIQTNKRSGMQTMDDAIYQLYLNHKIDAEHALQFAMDVPAMERKLY